jgi:hypothetical protein
MSFEMYLCFSKLKKRMFIFHIQLIFGSFEDKKVHFPKKVISDYQRWVKFQPSELLIPILIFRLYRPIFLVDFNTLRITSLLQNEDL